MTADERRSVTLTGGRVLSYVEAGAPDGDVVLHHHGGLMSAGDVIPLDGPARVAGVRLLAFDRPGIAGSTLVRDRTLLDGARDAEEALDLLGVGGVRVSGWSMGGPYALATAYHLGDRVVKAAIVAGAVPLDDPARLAELNEMDRKYTEMAEEHAARLRRSAEALGTVARFTPSLWARAAGKDEGTEDAAALRRDADAMAAAARDGMTQPDGVVEEYRAWARPWGFAPADVAVPVDVWQGTEDHLVPESWGAWLAATLPGAEYHRVEGSGHFLLLEHADEVFAALLR